MQTCGGADFYEKDGKCKACVRSRVAKYRRENPEKVRAADAAKYAKHKDKINMREAKRRKEIPEVFKERNRRYYAQNRVAGQKKRRAYYASHKSEHKARMERWHLENPGANRTYGQNRRTRIAGKKLSKDIASKLLVLQKWKCACCGKKLGKNYHLDHIFPIVLGGENVDANIQLLRGECNLKKHMKHPVDFMREKGFLL